MMVTPSGIPPVPPPPLPSPLFPSPLLPSPPLPEGAPDSPPDGGAVAGSSGLPVFDGDGESPGLLVPDGDAGVSGEVPGEAPGEAPG